MEIINYDFEMLYLVRNNKIIKIYGDDYYQRIITY